LVHKAKKIEKCIEESKKQCVVRGVKLIKQVTIEIMSSEEMLRNEQTKKLPNSGMINKLEVIL